MIKSTEQKVVKFILNKKLIDTGDRILVALSGGADSVFLLEFLLKYKKRFKIDIAAFHLNHKLRGKEAAIDEKFCKNLTAQKEIPFYSTSKNVKLFAKRNRMSVEEAGRELRYGELLKIAKTNNYTKIATAHNADDNTETVLLNLIKGTGINGLSGIPEIREKIIRPILVLSKKEILDYLHNKKINYRTDSSNVENNYPRNYLRNEIIPLIKDKLNPQFDRAVFRTSQIIRGYTSLIDAQINNAVKKAVTYKQQKLIINLKHLKETDVRLYGDVLRKSVKKYFNEELESNNISDLLKLIKAQTGSEIKFSNKIVAVKERDSIIIYLKKREMKNVKQVEINIGEEKQLEGKLVSISVFYNKKLSFYNTFNKEYISEDNIKSSFILRRWKEGDRFYPLGMKNSKKLSDFLTEQKVRSLEKKGQLVLTNAGKIVWVVGIRIDERYKISAKTKKVLELCLN
ncbi:MAG: tRNA lysidine(34) synthetase TilS [Ignavibacteriaceae bacterium]